MSQSDQIQAETEYHFTQLRAHFLTDQLDDTFGSFDVYIILDLVYVRSTRFHERLTQLTLQVNCTSLKSSSSFNELRKRSKHRSCKRRSHYIHFFCNHVPSGLVVKNKERWRVKD
ncbi:unnamed protein product [Albugo candida]|uniref:Uncharacterized protein n=1 Tax=Albugo candida TaxID=65357 RepID=A0A024G9Q3_9STRA|nr:unnamed protein product [Albugo candida]|eukprot:CCI43611.1 unnamed protein product [Albugo candida]